MKFRCGVLEFGDEYMSGLYLRARIFTKDENLPRVEVIKGLVEECD
jgi:hypothetical protein